MVDRREVTRKSVTLPKPLWDRIAEWRFANRIGSEAEAFRRLIELALKKVSS